MTTENLVRSPEEYTIEDFGWVCPEGHNDCADTEDGPCQEERDSLALRLAIEADCALAALREVPTVAQTEGVFATALDAETAYYDELDANTVYCSICDGIGHGQPGYGPCPVFEDTGRGPDPDEGFRF